MPPDKMSPARKKQRLSSGEVRLPNIKAPTEAVAAIAEAKEEKTEQPRRSLFVRSLPASTTTESLTALFSESYPIKHATAIIDPETKECRGYGFVTFADADDALRAREEFNGHTLDGRKLRVEIAEPRQRNAGKDGTADTATPLAKVAAQEETDHQAPKLIIRNLPWTIKTSDQLSKLFLSYGKVKQAYLPKKASGLLSGFGFVLLRGRKNAEKAIEGVNGKVVDGRALAVDWAVTKAMYDDITKDDADGQDAGAQVNGATQRVGDQPGIDPEDDEDQQSSEDIDEDESDDDLDVEGDGPADNDAGKEEDKSLALFIRNLPFTCSDEDLQDHFEQFGSVRYARVVMDANTGRSKGTGFVCFYNKPEADACLKDAPRRVIPSEHDRTKGAASLQLPTSVLQNEAADPSGQYTLEGRVLQVTRAVQKSEANRLTEEGVAQRHKRNDDKRRLYLLSEGTISSGSALWEQLSPSERTMREASAKQRKALIESNPSLHLSLTRLSVRNVPRSVDSKELKALAREAIVGFAQDVKAGSRQKLSKEELIRGGDEMRAAEVARKKSGKGIVKQAKVVFEGASGSKVTEDSGAGRSRGYGFIEYHTHRSALMGLRWLNGHAVGYQVREDGKGKGKKTREEVQDRKKRLIVEFAIENAQVVKRRKDNETKAREHSRAVQDGASIDVSGTAAAEDGHVSAHQNLQKRKRGVDTHSKQATGKITGSRASAMFEDAATDMKADKADEKLKKRNQIIGRKRAIRRARKTNG